MVVHNNILAGASGATGVSGDTYQISKSLRFNSSDSAYLNNTFSSAGSTTTWTLSFWIKRASLGGTKNIFVSYNGSSIAEGDYAYMAFDTSDRLVVGYAYASYKTTSRKFRDVSSWYHIVIRLETGNSTASDRVQIYVNGVKETSFASTHDPELNESLAWNKAHDHRLCTELGQFYNDCYLAEVHFVDGQALAASDFGKFDDNNVWQPKEFTHGTAKHLGDWIGDTAGTPYSAPTGSLKAFDGDDSTGAAPTTGTAFVFSPSTPITGISKVRIRAYRDPSQSDDDGMQLNGTEIGSNWTAGGATSEVEFTVNNLTSLRWETNSISHWYKVYKIEIYYDGAYHTLVPGDINSFHLDFSDNSSNAALGTDSSGNSNTWTVNNLTANAINYVQSSTGSLYSGNWSQAFNGSTSYPAPYIYNTTSTVTLSTAISGVIELYVGLPGTYQNNPIVYTLSNGATYSKTTATAEWISFGSQSNVTSISVNAPDPGSNVFAVRVDGTVLVSSDAFHTDSLIDTPTNYTAESGNNGGNYCVFNSLRDDASGFNEAPTNGNLDTNPRGDFTGTIPVTSGKWYWEITITTATNSGQGYLGVLDVQHIQTAGARTWGISQIAAMRDTGDFYGNGSTGSGVSYAQGDILGFALDATSGKLWISKNNTWINSGDPAGGTGHAFSGLSYSAYTLIASDSNTGQVYSLNAGQRPFAYTPPTDFLSICTTNLPDPTIADGSTAFDVKTYTGTGSTNAQTGLNFSPDFLWIKRRNGSNAHALFDQIRGVTKVLESSNNSAEKTNDPAIASFDANGFTVNGTYNQTNASGQSYVGWAWDGADLVTNSAYNQSQTWSSGTVTGTLYSGSSWANVFDGSLPSTLVESNSAMSYNSTGDITLTFPTSISGTIRVYASGAAGSATGTDSKIVLSDNSEITCNVLSSAPQFFSFGSKTNITSITLKQAQYGVRLAGVEVDGKLLTDTGIIPAGSLNSSLYNQSQTWSNQVSGTQNSSYPFSNVFNADNMATHAYPANGTEAVFTPSPSFSNATTVTIWYYAPTLHANAFKLNGTGVGNSLSATSGTNTHTFDVTGTGFTSLSWSKGVYGSEDTGLLRIDVDGVQLVDNGISVANVPSIASTVRANQSSGFSIVSYTGNGTAGATVGHGLNSKPDMILLKSRGDTQNWMVYHSALGATKAVFLSTADSVATSSVYFNNTEPTSSVFSLGTRAGINLNSDPMIAYCFSAVEGYSAFGSYTGNGSADGPFVYTGFRPAFIMIKNTDRTEHWYMMDANRDGFNDDNDFVLADITDAEYSAATYPTLDILSNGFKIRGTHVGRNASSEDFIYVAFAEHSFKTVRAR